MEEREFHGIFVMLTDGSAGSGGVLFDSFDAAGADGGMIGVGADIGFPVPATLAFLAVGVDNTFFGKIRIWVVLERPKFNL